MSRWDTWEYDELVEALSDYHKDVFGYRLRMNGKPREDIVNHLVCLDEYMEKMKETPEGRAQLREDGWVINEEDYA